MMHPDMIMDMGMLLELFYSSIIIMSSLMIYLATKEIHDLSGHRGIGYFRNAFLFFAIAFFFRFMTRYLITELNIARFLNIHPVFLAIATSFVFLYASTMAMFYLIYSLMWERIDKDHKWVSLLHVLALLIAGISILSIENVMILLVVQAIVFLFIAMESYRSYAKSRRKRKIFNTYVIYYLLFVFWILNIIDILIPNFLQFTQVVVYIASAVTMLMILYKVLRKTV